MNNILVVHCKLIIKEEYYLKRWLNILDTMSGKDKGITLEKPYMIILIEVDIQHIIRIHLSNKNEVPIEED